MLAKNFFAGGAGPDLRLELVWDLGSWPCSAPETKRPTMMCMQSRTEVRGTLNLRGVKVSQLEPHGVQGTRQAAVSPEASGGLGTA